MNGLRNNLPSWWMRTPIQKGLLNQNEKTWDKLHMSFDMAPSITTHIKKCVFSLRPWTVPYQKDWTVSSVGRAHSRLKLSNWEECIFLTLSFLLLLQTLSIWRFQWAKWQSPHWLRQCVPHQVLMKLMEVVVLSESSGLSECHWFLRPLTSVVGLSPCKHQSIHLP